jgi:putative flippase GtrA
MMKMKPTLTAVPLGKLLRFATVGIVVMGVFMALNWLLGRSMGEQAAFLCAYPPALLLHFLLNKIWTFENRERVSGRQVRDYVFMVGLTFVIQWGVFTALRAWTVWPAWGAAGLANVAQMTVSFVLMQARVFAIRSPRG